MKYFQSLPEKAKDIIVEKLLKDKSFWDKECPNSEEMARENVLYYLNNEIKAESRDEWLVNIILEMAKITDTKQ